MSTEIGEAPTEEVVEAPTGEEVIEEPKVPGLPSDTEEFKVPEKFEGKSIEEVIKSYQELERFKGAPKEEEEETEEQNEEPKEPKDLHSEEDTAKYKEYVDYYKENGSLTEEQYKELADKGYDKKVVDDEIDYYNYKYNKALDSVLEPLEGGQEKFKEVALWANKTKTPEQVKEFNDILSKVPKLAQQAMLKGLYEEYSDSGNVTEGPIHTNAPITQGTKGYKNESEFFKDMNNPSYKNDRLYAKQVEEKLGRSDTSAWSF